MAASALSVFLSIFFLIHQNQNKMKKEARTLTPAQERRAIDLFNSFLSDDDHYLKMVLLFQKMQQQYLLSYHCDGLPDDCKEELQVCLDNFGYLLGTPFYTPRP
jgi:hypothetical protein